MDRKDKRGFEDTYAHKLPAVSSEAPTLADDSPASEDPRTDLASPAITRYRLGATIGRGGMGEVLSARDEQIGRSVAIKRLNKHDASEGAITRFLREARIQGRLEHPAVVPVHELSRDTSGQAFFVMKQLSGVTLAEVIDKLSFGEPATVAKFPRQRLLRAFAEVCLAIEFAHTRGVVHRDVKPANIMLGDFGEVYVLDWGVARLADGSEESGIAGIDTLGESETVAGSMLGTPGYMSPEQIRNDPELDGRADVYSLGCTLFEILALQPLHPRGNSAIVSALEGEVDPRPSLRPSAREVPPELDAVCVTATQLDPAKRFATARAIGDEVQRYLDGDRDHELRKELAREELARARDAIARNSSADAIRAASRALALDPTAREPADLVGRLMLEPPAKAPPEVEAALHELDLDALYSARPLLVTGAVGYLVFLPILYWVGIRDPAFFLAGGLTALALALSGLQRSRRWMTRVGQFSVLANLVMIILVVRMSSPFLVGPALAITVATSIATHPTVIRPWLLAGSLIVAVLGPWCLELAGVLSRTTSVAGGAVVLQTSSTSLDPVGTVIALALFVVVSISLGAGVARRLTDDRRAAQRIVQTQAWQLRQLLPR
jgi:serine/threonine-protein kinase